MFLESALGAGGLKGRRSRVTAGAGRGRVRCGPRPPPSFRIHDGTYEPSPVRQVLIPKKQPGKFRPLGIPCLRDRVAQTSAMLVLGPIFEADLEPEQYGYRPGRSAKDAVGRIPTRLLRHVSTQRIRVGRCRPLQLLRWDCEREWKRMVRAPGTGEAKRSAAAPADPEVVDRPPRRRFSPSYKLRIVEEADRCTEPGEVGQLLRREGLYSSHLTTWRKAGIAGR